MSLPFSVKHRIKRHRSVVESFGSASGAIGRIESGMSLFAITRGQFSMLDCVLHCLAEIGEASVSVWTWAIADHDVEAMCGLMARSEIRGGRLILDASADKRSPEMVNKWRDRFGDGSVKVCKNHAKIARIWNDDFRLLLRGSMNFNYNPRFEQLDISEGGPEFSLVESIEAELPVLPRHYDNHQVESASKLNRAYEYSSLHAFDGLKTWSK